MVKGWYPLFVHVLQFHNILEIADNIVLVSGFLSAFCPRWVQNDIVCIIGGGGGKYVFVCKTCGKLGGSGGMLPGKF